MARRPGAFADVLMIMSVIVSVGSTSFEEVLDTPEEADEGFLRHRK